MEHIDRSPGVKKQRWRVRSFGGSAAASEHSATVTAVASSAASAGKPIRYPLSTWPLTIRGNLSRIDKVGLDPTWTAHQQLLFLFQQSWHEVWRIVGQENEEVLDYIEDAQKRGGAKVGQNKQGKSPTIIGRERPIVGACTSD